jgi:hypothetical protein
MRALRTGREDAAPRTEPAVAEPRIWNLSLNKAFTTAQV